MGSNPTLSATINKLAVPKGWENCKKPADFACVFVPENLAGRLRCSRWGLENGFFSKAFVPQYEVWSPIYLM